jgi:putative ABC transport system permease protein
MKSYLKFLSRNKLYTAIEAAGLIVSLAFLLVIGSSIWDQRAIIKGIPGHENLYLVGPEGRPDMGQYRLTRELTALPQVERAAAYKIVGMQMRLRGRDHVIMFAAMDEALLEMVPLKDIHGNRVSLPGTENVLITESAALRLFPGEDPVGQTVAYVERGGLVDVEIAGIIQDPVYSPYGDFDLVVSMDSKTNQYALAARESDYLNNGRTFNVMVMAQLVPGADMEGLDERIRNLPGWIMRPEEMGEVQMLMPFDELYYSSVAIPEFRQGKALYLHVLIALGAMLFLLALLSFVNLSLAASGHRAREMASRRLLGESRRQVFVRVLLETLGFTLFCFLLAIPLAYAMVPGLDSLRPGDLTIPFRLCSNVRFWLLAVAGVVVSSWVAGIAPAALCASYRPLDVVTGQVRRRQKMTFNRICIVFQSALALILIIMTITLYRQLRYMETADLGVDLAEDLYYYNQPFYGLPIMADVLESSPYVKQVGYTSNFPTRVPAALYLPRRSFQYRIQCDSVGFALLGFRLEEQFSQITGTTLLTRSAANEAGIAQGHANPEYYFEQDDVNPITGEKTYPVIGGIIGDFRTTAVNETPREAGPAMVVVYPDSPDGAPFSAPGYLIQTTGDHREFEDWFIPKANQIIRKHTSFDDLSGFPITAGYLKDIIAAEHDDLRQYLRIVGIVCLVCVLLSVLSLLAMSSFYAGTQAKGIAIRKVFGGTIDSETWRGIDSYMLWITIAVVIAVPVGVVLARRFLQDYSERISGYWWIFVVAVLLVLVISFVSVLWQTLKAARTNPATELKKE